MQWPAVFVVIACFGPVFASLGHAQINVVVPATAEWFDTGVYLQAGDSVALFRVQGRWLNVPDSSDFKGPDGWGGPYEGAYLPKEPFVGLIGRVGNTSADMFYVDVRSPASEGRYVHRARASGILFLAMNDVPGTYGDNQGSMEATIQPSTLRLPDLTGLSPEGADGLLRSRYHLTLARPFGYEHSERTKGTIISQKPVPGTPVKEARDVQVNVSDGPEPPPLLLPDLTGMTLEEADRLLRSQYHLTLAQPFKREHSEEPEGRIFQQKPRPGTPVGEIKTVLVSVSMGPQMVRVPPVVGSTAPEAVAKLGASELKGKLAQPPLNSVHPRGTVLKSFPGENALVPRGSIVSYWTASGKNLVPDVRGMSRADASAKLAEEGFKTGTVSEEYGSSRAGLIASSDPKDGMPAELGSAVALTVVTDEVQIPNVVGNSREEAERRLRDAGFEPETGSDLSVAKPGVVTTQRPAGRGRKGQIVALTVTVLHWVAIGSIAALAAATATLWPRIRWSVDLSGVRSRAPADVNAPVSAPEISFRIEVVPGKPPAEFSTPVTKEE